MPPLSPLWISLDFCGKSSKNMRLPAHRLFFCLSAGFSNAGIPLSTGVFKILWISSYYLFGWWKVFKSVFHRLLKTFVDLQKNIVLFVGNLCFFRFFTEILRKSAVLSRKYRTIFRFSAFFKKFPKPLENFFRNRPVIQTRRYGARKYLSFFILKKRFSTFPKGRKYPLDSAEENKGKVRQAEICPIFHRICRFHEVLHPLPAAAKKSFQKYSTKLPEMKKHKFSAQNTQTAVTEQIPRTENAKNRHFSDEKPLFHKANTPYYCYY
jgi:hypothetical protein